MLRSVSQILGLQHLLQQSDIVELFEGFLDVEPEPQEPAPAGGSKGGCEHALDSYFGYFCGSLRNEPSGGLRRILDRSCYGDSYQHGMYVCRHELS